MSLDGRIVTPVNTPGCTGLPRGITVQKDVLWSVLAIGVAHRIDAHWALHAAVVSSPFQIPLYR